MKTLITLTLGILAISTVSAQSSTADLDRDGIVNSRDADIDNDGIRNGSDSNVDGGIAKTGPMRGKYVGDQLANNDAAETDIDSDGLLDGSVRETDIDGDGVVNVRDADMDGDAVANVRDADMNSDGFSDLLDYIGPLENGYYVDPAAAAEITQEVSTQLRSAFKLPAGGSVRVVAYKSDPSVGLWNVLTADRVSLFGIWKIEASAPNGVNLFYLYGSPGENRFYAQYPSGPVTFYNWMSGERVGFFYPAMNETPSGEIISGSIYQTFFAQRYPGTLVNTYAGNYGLGYFYDGELGVFSGMEPVIEQQRGIFKTFSDWQSAARK